MDFPYKIDKNAAKSQNKAKSKSAYAPKPYVSPILNKINEWARATRPETVGKIASVLFPEYISTKGKHSSAGWKEYYLREHATEYWAAFYKLKRKFEEVKKSINEVSDKDIQEWLDNILFEKTFEGLYWQEVILRDVAARLDEEFVPSTAEDESVGIDGYIGGKAYSGKPSSYQRSQASQHEKIDATMIYYDDQNEEYLEYDISEEK